LLLILFVGGVSLPDVSSEMKEVQGLNIKLPVLLLSIEGRGLLTGISVGFKVGDTIDYSRLKQGEEKICQQLRSKGFLWAEVLTDTIIDSSGIRVKYRVNRHQQAKIGGWRLIGNDSVGDNQLLSVLPRKGKGFNNALLSQVENRLRGKYASAGFPFAEISLIGMNESAGYVFPLFKVFEGPRVKISFITFSGAGDKSERYRLSLLRQTGFRGSVYYKPTQVRMWKRNLEGGGWITIDSQEIVMRQSQYGMRFWVSQSRSGEVHGVLGYSPESRTLMGWVRLELFNILFTGRRLKGKWYSTSKEANYQLEYTEPWIFKNQFSLSAAVEHNVFDTSFAQTIFSLTGKFLKEAAEFSLGTGFDRTVSRNSRNRLWVRTGFVFDNRDQKLNPRQGLIFRIETRAAQQYPQNSGSGMTGWVEADITPVVSVVKDFTLANRLNLCGIFSETIPERPDLFSVGGMENIRGFREGSYFATRFCYWNCEWHYHWGSKTRLHCFFDMGLFLEAETERWDWISGYGVGGRWLTRLGIVGIDYGVPLAGSLRQGKIHLSLQTGF